MILRREEKGKMVTETTIRSTKLEEAMFSEVSVHLLTVNLP